MTRGGFRALASRWSSPRDPGSPKLRMIAEPKYNAFRRELDTQIIIWEYDWIPRVQDFPNPIFDQRIFCKHRCKLNGQLILGYYRNDEIHFWSGRFHVPKASIFGIYTVVKVDGYPLPCIGSEWPLTNRHLLGVASHLLSRWYLYRLKTSGGVGLECPLFGESIQLLKDLVLNAWLQNSSPRAFG